MAMEMSAVELAAALRRRELSAVEALDDALERADAIPEAFVVRLDERAREAAAAADAALARGEDGPLTGIPITVKDSHWLAGVPTTFARSPSTRWSPWRPSPPCAGSRTRAR